MDDIGLCWHGILIQQRLGCQNHSRSAKAALQGKLVNKGLLDRVECAIRPGQPFNRQDTAIADFISKEGAGAHRKGIDQDRAGATDLNFARDLGAGEVESLAQDLGQCFLGFDLYLDGSVIELETELNRLPRFGHTLSGGCTNPPQPQPPH